MLIAKPWFLGESPPLETRQPGEHLPKLGPCDKRMGKFNHATSNNHLLQSCFSCFRNTIKGRNAFCKSDNLYQPLLTPSFSGCSFRTGCAIMATLAIFGATPCLQGTCASSSSSWPAFQWPSYALCPRPTFRIMNRRITNPFACFCLMSCISRGYVLAFSGVEKIQISETDRNSSIFCIRASSCSFVWTPFDNGRNTASAVWRTVRAGTAAAGGGGELCEGAFCIYYLGTI